MRILAHLMRLRQICCHPRLFDSNFKDESGKLLLFEEKDRLLEEYALVRLPAAQLQELDPAAIAGQRVGPYGAEALVRREKIPAGFVMEHTSLEDIILFLARKGGEPG